MSQESQVSLFEMVVGLSNALDLISPKLVGHHRRVTHIAFGIATQMGLSVEEKADIFLAGLLHDSGALSLGERLETIQFEMENPYQHAHLGYLLLKNFEPLAKPALLVRYHHIPWEDGKGSEFKGEKVQVGSHILHLADRIDMTIEKQNEILGQVNRILEKVEENRGRMFVPEMIDAFKVIAANKNFWQDVISQSNLPTPPYISELPAIEMDLENLAGLSELFSHVIDFRSKFTTTHSSGVASAAETLAGLIGFSQKECKMTKIAGYLHDIGMLIVPVEVLEKPEKLSEEEYNIVKQHPDYTHQILKGIRGMGTINDWASFHHERLDGKGYPFHLKEEEISSGSRIVAIAEVFTALTEDHPYRKGMSKKMTLEIIDQMAENNALDPKVVSILKSHYDELISARVSGEFLTYKKYKEFRRAAGSLL